MKINKKELVVIIEEELAAVIEEENQKELDEAGLRDRVRTLGSRIKGAAKRHMDPGAEWHRIGRSAPGSAGAEIGPGPQRGVLGSRVGQPDAPGELGQRVEPVSLQYRKDISAALSGEFAKDLGSAGVAQILNNILRAVGKSGASGQLEEAAPFSVKTGIGGGETSASPFPRRGGASAELEHQIPITITAADLLRGVNLRSLNAQQVVARIGQLLNSPDVPSRFNFNIDASGLSGAAEVGSPESTSIDVSKYPDIQIFLKRIDRVQAADWVKDKTNLYQELVALLEWVINTVDLPKSYEQRALRAVLANVTKAAGEGGEYHQVPKAGGQKPQAPIRRAAKTPTPQHIGGRVLNPRPGSGTGARAGLQEARRAQRARATQEGRQKKKRLVRVKRKK